jgi:hypothetical protein
LQLISGVRRTQEAWKVIDVTARSGWQRLSKAEYERLSRTPRRRHATFSIADRGCVLRGRVPSPTFWFERNDVGQDEKGRAWRVPYLSTVSLIVDGFTGAFFYLEGKRLASCTFAYDLTPPRLHKTVVAMRKAGLARYVVPAAEWAIREMPGGRRPVLEQALLQIASSKRAKDQR